MSKAQPRCRHVRPEDIPDAIAPAIHTGRYHGVLADERRRPKVLRHRFAEGIYR